MQPEDTGGLAEALRKALTQDEDTRKLMELKARSKAVNDFTQEAMCRKTLALYQQLMPNR